MSAVDFSALDAAGLNLHAVFDLARLPAPLQTQLRADFDPRQAYRQLLLIGHGGKRLWNALQASGIRSPHPIDDFSVRSVEQWFAAQLPGHALRIVYPGTMPVGLQALGQIAGWHHASPFRVGVNQTWGSWFAYRVALLADTELPPTPALPGASPCAGCADKPCIASCPGAALEGEAFSLVKCVAYRRQADSRCKTTCIARLACPVGAEHRYEEAQIRHSYSRSLAEIERHA